MAKLSGVSSTTWSRACAANACAGRSSDTKPVVATHAANPSRLENEVEVDSIDSISSVSRWAAFTTTRLALPDEVPCRVATLRGPFDDAEVTLAPTANAIGVVRVLMVVARESKSYSLHLRRQSALHISDFWPSTSDDRSSTDR